ncbi:hypothetical protein [Pseudomonas gingeri]|uniref:hypothetical protein n=1 Tax=Pseudomonas gingeri TaxID=117681 RepID=UPI0015A15FDC|nr:hypothetical protein [Pseudomonas gingeri]NWD08174.1 hypothetical protein [Pseudomonas gingeri]NWE34916.1 hypothetical protein [Pseudomonas gingeri]NWE59505.1 hypothetical protein [Pseudomonas gingeri]NWF04166.1 hypothetical protein [Pseudomonas gingeri]
MSAQAKLFEMNEDRHKVACPFYGEKDYAFTFEFTAVNAVWQAHDADSASLVAKPNIWMGEDKEDHHVLEQRQDAADERVFSYRLGRSFTLVCLNDQLYLMLRVWEENQEGEVLSASRRNRSAVKVATRMVSGKAEALLLSHEDPCVIKLETRNGLSTVKVWNTRKTGEAPYTLGDFGDAFRDFFSGFSEFQFNTIPVDIKNGRHSLRLKRAAAWVGNPLPEGEENFRDYLEEKARQLKCFGYRQLPLEQLSAYYPLQKNRWETLGSDPLCSVENAHFTIESTQGLCFDALRNKCSLSLTPSAGHGASGSFMLNLLLKDAGVSEVQTMTSLIDAWNKSEAVFSRRKHGLDFKRIVEEVERFDPAEPFVPGAHYKDRALVDTIRTSTLANRFAHFVGQLEVSDFVVEGQLKATMSQLQLKLNEDKKTLYTRRADIGVLTCRTSAPASSTVFAIQILRRMQVDSANGELSYEEQMVFTDGQGNDHGAIGLNGFPCFLLLSLSDDRKAFNLFVARADSDLSTALDASLTHAVSHATGQAESQKNQTIDEVILTLGVGSGGDEGPMISLKDLSLWSGALWQREGLLTAGNKIDKDYNAKTLAHLSFSGSLETLVAQYKRSLKV